MAEKQSLHSKLTDWLSEQGYPLEMEVAQEFRSSKFIVAQSTYYSDPETGEAREIDVMAALSGTFSDMEVRLICLVECKLPAEPWVIFSSGREPGDEQFDHYSFLGSDLGVNCLARLYWKKYFPLPRALAFRERVGYGVTRKRKHSYRSGDGPGRDRIWRPDPRVFIERNSERWRSGANGG